ncbi:putative aminotransferase [Labilithrix luteola]|uniref:Putative aminotransferase n=1 Tax=Labilithrix luteola TaxID=1391654 RepID=A0A0K1QGR7_9BACT|nr:pyridoxal phosphate-dependent aminotransferase [Labilithrix luteola]AKV04630.1 putative aminotransferase [Labilithrix luteola]
MAFSRRTSQHDEPNALAQAVARVRAEASKGGPPLLDLTVSNPTTAGIPYDEKAILDALRNPLALAYSPEPLGLPSGRAAVAGDWTASGVPIEARHVALTASTSEAYAALFTMLADPGDEILVPQPSYPLLGYLAAFDAVELRPYPLVYAGGWHVDLDALRSAVGPRTRAIVVVAPNNPTGSYLSAAELEAMLDLGLPIISDEVFARYPLGAGVPDGRVATILEAKRGLVFALSGLSKLAALPQLKLGWIGVGGDEAKVNEAMARLELVLDAYLSVGAPVQHALPRLLALRSARHAISARTRHNLGVLRAAIHTAPSASVLDVEAGWYAIVRVPETQSDEEWAIDLVESDRVHVHPGYFFDMHRGAHLVVSLLTPEAVFAEGIERLFARIARL